MIKERLHFKIESGKLRLYLAGHSYRLLNQHLASISDLDAALEMILAGTIKSDINSLSLSVNELRVLHDKIAVYFRCYEEEETFKHYANLLSITDKNIREDLLREGFALERQSVDYVDFVNEEYVLSFVKDRDGAGLFITDKATKQVFESMQMLEKIDWDIANTYKLRMRKYEAKLSYRYRDTAVLLAIIEFVKLHLIPLLAKRTILPLLERIAVESRFKRELSQRVFTMSDNDPIRQSFLENNFHLSVNQENS
jgi:hypothetical protein